MNPRIEYLQEKKLIGKRLTMSLVNNRTGELWKSFGPRLKEIENRVNTDRISMQEYGDSFSINSNNSNVEFEKWATVEVENFENLPKDLEKFILNGGQYAVFDYKGLSTDPSIFQYIFTVWLPNSEYKLENRPHFEVLGEKYKNNDPNSEEEIWIPIGKK